VHYAYHPCDAAVLSLHEFAGKNWQLRSKQRLMMQEISSGMDELGILLTGHARGVHWYGSRLTIEEARDLALYNNATSLQVVAAVLGGMVWAIENPRAGVVESDHIDHTRVLDVARPYLGEPAVVCSDWTPLAGRGALFSEDLDLADPWQFKNFRVI
jgi:homospermidine synthase